MDKVIDSGSIDAGSIPVRDTRKNQNFVLSFGFYFYKLIC
jgi:hypothetical protein